MKEIIKTRSALVTLMLAMLLAMGGISQVFAQTGVATTTNWNDMPVNYIDITALKGVEAEFSTTNSQFKRVENFQRYYPDTGEVGTYAAAVVYTGPLTYGTNRTATTNASLGEKAISGSFSLRYKNAAILPDGTKADVLMTISDVRIFSGTRPSSVTASQNLNIGIVALSATGSTYMGLRPRTGLAASTAVAVNTAIRVKTDLVVVESGTTTPVSSDFPVSYIAVEDLDTPDRTVTGSAADSTQQAGRFSEGIGMISGFLSPAKVATATKIKSQTVDGQQKFRGTDIDGGTEASRVVVAITPQGTSYYWYGSCANGYDGVEGAAGMGTNFGITPKVNVNATAGTGGTITKPGATTYIINGTTDYEYAPSRGYTVKSLTVDGSAVTLTEDQKQNGGTYTFAKLIERNSSTYDHTIDVQFEGPKVTYEWDGDHPDLSAPTGGEITPGNYTVDTTYSVGQKVEGTKDGQSGFWLFEGWDKTGTIEVYEDTTIKGTWRFVPYYEVTYEWEGEHPDREVPAGQQNIASGAEYTVDTTYQPNQTEKGSKNGQKGTWKFNGWDKNGTLEIVEDTVIKGTWTFTPEYDITTSATGGTITETETDIPEGQNRVISYTPNSGYQLKSLTVDGEPKDIKDYPASYSFTGIDRDHDVRAVFELIPALTIEKAADKEIYNAGDTVTYTITVSQTVEGAEARNIVIKDTLPPGLTLNKNSFEGSVTVVEADDDSYELSMSSLERSATYTYTAVTSADMDAEALINVATATGENVPGEPARDDATVKSLKPKPEITKVVSNETPIYGEEIEYIITVKEPQEGIVLRNAVMTDPIPEGIEPTGVMSVDGDGEASFSEGKFTLNIPILEDEVVFRFKAIVKATTGNIDNIATLNGDGVSPVTDNADITVKEPTPSLNKTISKEKGTVGDTIVYTVVAFSDIPLKNAVITDTLPEGVELVEDSVSADKTAEISVEEGVITVKADSLDEPITITYEAKVTAEGEHVNTVSLTAQNYPKGPLKDEATIKAVEPIPIIEKVVDKEIFKVGETVKYTVKAYAKSGVIYDAVTTDTLPKGLALDKNSVEASGGELEVEGNTITVTADALTSQAIVITYSAKANKAGKHINTATLSGENIDEVEATATVKAENTPPKASASPKTGDETNVLAFVMLLVLATAGVVALRRKY